MFIQVNGLSLIATHRGPELFRAFLGAILSILDDVPVERSPFPFACLSSAPGLPAWWGSGDVWEVRFDNCDHMFAVKIVDSEMLVRSSDAERPPKMTSHRVQRLPHDEK